MTDVRAATRTRRIAWAIVRYVVGVGLGTLIFVLLAGKRGEFVAALHHLAHLNVAWATGAVLAEVISIVGYAFIQQRVLRWSGAGLSLRGLAGNRELDSG